MNYNLRFLWFPGIHNSLPSSWAKLGYSRIKIDHNHFIADSLPKDVVLTVGVNLRLHLLSLCYSLKHFEVKCNHPFLTKFAILIFLSFKQKLENVKRKYHKCFLQTILDVNAFMRKYVQSKCKIFIWLDVCSLIPLYNNSSWILAFHDSKRAQIIYEKIWENQSSLFFSLILRFCQVFSNFNH